MGARGSAIHGERESFQALVSDSVLVKAHASFINNLRHQFKTVSWATSISLRFIADSGSETMGGDSHLSDASPGQRKLEVLNAQTPHTFTRPSKLIHDVSDVSYFHSTLAYRDLGIFVLQLNHALCPRNRPGTSVPRVFSLTTTQSAVVSIETLQLLLADIEALITLAPPESGPRRFGNVSFRKWYVLLEARIDELLSRGLLGTTFDGWNSSCKDEVASYLLGAFGSAQRLDYGTGHELSFIAFLGCLWKLGYFKNSLVDGDIEREIVLSVLDS